jgi:hypothetical protein
VPQAAQLVGARSSDHASATVLVFEDDEAVTLTLEAPLSGRIQLRDDDTGGPLAGVDLEWVPLQALEPPEFRGTTGADGFLSEALPSGTYVVRSRSPGVALIADHRPWSTPDREDAVTVSVSEGSPAVVFGERLWTLDPIQVLDATSGVPVERAAAWARYAYSRSQTWKCSDIWPLRSTPNGELYVSDHAARVLKAQGPWTLCVWSPGYFLQQMDYTEVPPLASAPVAVGLTRYAKWELLVEDDSGRPFAGYIRIVERHRDLLDKPMEFFDGAVPLSGRIPGDMWRGGALFAAVGGADAISIPADALGRSSTVRLVVPRLGRVTVRGVPETFQGELVVLSSGSGVPVGGTRVGRSYLFEDLVAGTYSVASRDRCDQAVLGRGFLSRQGATGVSLEPGEHVELDWESEWAESLAFEGEIVVRGVDATDVFVAWANPRRTITLERMIRYPIRHDSTYRVVGAKVDDVLVAGTVDREGRLIALATGDPGADLSVACATLAVRVQGMSDAEVHVGFDVPLARIGVVPSRLFYSSVGTVRVPCVPVDVASIKVVYDDGESEVVREYELRLTPGESLELVVHPD